MVIGNYEINATGEYLNPDSVLIYYYGEIFDSKISTLYENVTNYEEFYVIVELTKKDGTLFAGTTVVSLIYSEGIFVSENEIEVAGGESIAFIAYATVPGEYRFEVVTSNSNPDYISGTLVVYVSPAKINLELIPTVIFTQPYDSFDYFEVTAFITNYFGYVLPLADLLQLNLSINCTAGVECLDPMLEESITTHQGIANTTEHRFRSSGNFEISSIGINLLSDSVIVKGIRNSPKNFSAEVFPEMFSIYIDFNLKITIIGEDDQPYTVDEVFDIYDDLGNFVGYHENTGGFNEFIGYLTSTNASFIIVSSESIYIEVPVEVYPLFIDFSLSNTVIFT